jgi:hypothetical protein
LPHEHIAAFIMDSLWGVEPTRRVPLALAFVAGNLVESGLMAIGAVPRDMAASLVLTPLILGAMTLPVAYLVGGADVFAGTVVVVLGINALVYALVFAKGAALVVDELVLSSQTLAASCVIATLVMPGGWNAALAASAASTHPWATAVLAAGTLGAFVYVVFRPRVPRLAAFAAMEWVALCVVACCFAALHGSDFKCLWPGAPLLETLLHSFAAGMALFYLMFHSALILIPMVGWLAVRHDDQAEYLVGFAGDLENKLVARGIPLWLIAGCLALQSGTWFLIYSKRLLTPPGVILFVALGFSHVFLIELKRFVSSSARP